MAIKMDGHTITELELHASDGTTVTKHLTKELNLQTKTATTNGDVTSDAGYDGLLKVIVDVQGGESYPAPVTKVKCGTFTLNEDTTSLEIEHGENTQPAYVGILCKNIAPAKDGNKGKTAAITMGIHPQASASGNRKFTGYQYYHSTSGTLIVASGTSVASTTGKLTFNSVGTVAAQVVNASNETITAEYRWIAVWTNEV